MVEINSKADKFQTSSILSEKALLLLNKHAEKSGGGIISYTECRRVLSWLYHLSSKEVFLFLKELEKAGLICLVPFHGIRIIKLKK